MLKASTIAKRTGWRPWKNEEGHGLTDGESFCHTYEDDKGRVLGFTRYGGNRVDDLADALDAVSEHDDEHPAYTKLFGPFDDED